MKKLIYPTVVFFAMGLAACGGGGGGGSSSNNGNDNSSGGQPQPPNSQKLASTAQVIDYYGDSTVWGWKTNTNGDRVATPAPAAFATALGTSPTHTVTNKGVNGQTACELLRGANGQEDWATLINASPNTTVVILNHGINDANRQDTEYRTCLMELARTAKNAQKRVIFETPNPTSNPDLANYVQIMEEVAAQEGLAVIDQYAYLNQRYNGDINVIAPDTVHPDDPVYIVKGQYAAQVFLGLDR